MIRAVENTPPLVVAATVVVLAVSMGACASSAGPGVTPAPSVQELARLQRSGLLDQGRLHCVILAAAPLADEIATESRLLRELYRGRAGAAGASHARSVQRGMAAGEGADRAARAALDARRAAQQASRDGDHTRAAVFSGYAAELLSPARGPDAPVPEWRWAMSQRGAELDDEEADLFLEYAELRVASVRGNSTGENGRRLLAIEAEAPGVIDVYAGLLLRLHEDPAVRCEGTGPGTGV